MPELSLEVQTWVNTALIWIGFGSLAGLLARGILPFREPAGSLATLTLGITGSAIGLGLLSWIQSGGPSNPISPLGFLAAVSGAFGLLLVYQFLRLVVRERAGSKEQGAGSKEEEAAGGEQGAGSGE